MSRLAGLIAACAVLALAGLGSAAPAWAQAPAAPAAAPAPAPAPNACGALTDFVTATRPNLPQPIDEITQVTDMVVDCDAEVLTFVLEFLTPVEQRPADAIEAARNAFLLGACQQGIAAATGWTLAGEFHAADGTVTDRFETTAADCATVATAAAGELANYVTTVAAAFPAPLQIDDTLQITTAQADGTTLVLGVHLGGNFADAAAVTAELRSRLLPVLCPTSQVVALFRDGATIRLSIVDDAGRETLTLPLDGGVCGAVLAAATPAAPASPGAAAPAGAVDEAALCATAEAAVANMQALLPMGNDDGTETTAITLDCPTATITFVQTFAGPTDLYAGDALAERQTQHTVQHCSIDAIVAGLSVAVVTEVHGVDGTLLATLRTTPPDCDFVTAAMVAAALPVLSPEALAARLTEIAETNAPALPVQINETLSLVALFHSPTALVVFYQLSGNIDPAQLQAVAERMRTQMVGGDCNDPGQLQLLRSGASLTYRYSDTQSNSLFSITVTAADCGI